MSKQVIRIKSTVSQAGLEQKLLAPASDRYEQAEKVNTFFRAIAGGNGSAVVQMPVDTASASGTFTVGGSGASSVTVLGATLTGGTDYDISGLSNSQIAENVADAINDSASGELQVVHAVASSDIVTVTAEDPGLVGNLITISATGDITASGSTLAGGTAGTIRTFNFNEVE